MSDTRKDPRITLLTGQSRPETPDIGSQQGHRNASAQLLDSEGAITPKFERVLGHIFAKFATPPESSSSSTTNVPRLDDTREELLQPLEGSFLSSEGLDRYAVTTNGHPFTDDTKEELTFLDTTEDGHLTFEGFLQMYQLQTENDEEETWRDLSTHGFDRNLNLVSTRQSAVDEGTRVPMSELRGLGMGGEQIKPPSS